MQTPLPNALGIISGQLRQASGLDWPSPESVTRSVLPCRGRLRGPLMASWVAKPRTRGMVAYEKRVLSPPEAEKRSSTSGSEDGKTREKAKASRKRPRGVSASSPKKGSERAPSLEIKVVDCVGRSGESVRDEALELPIVILSGLLEAQECETDPFDLCAARAVVARVTRPSRESSESRLARATRARPPRGGPRGPSEFLPVGRSLGRRCARRTARSRSR